MGTKTKERPILFNGEMVKAILEGRKAQTRRPIKNKLSPTATLHHIDNFGTAVFSDGTCIRSPFGTIGDWLWVRETWNICPNKELVKDEPRIKWYGNSKSWSVVYKATSPDRHPDHPEYGKSRWRPSIHMPREASRIDLEITNFWIERLNDISEEDAMKEGCSHTGLNCAADEIESAREQFERLWESIYGPESRWDKKPWVWVYEFKSIKRLK